MFFPWKKNATFFHGEKPPRRPAPRRVGGLEAASAEAPNGAGAAGRSEIFSTKNGGFHGS